MPPTLRRTVPAQNGRVTQPAMYQGLVPQGGSSGHAEPSEF
jgi:hypothetical protein